MKRLGFSGALLIIASGCAAMYGVKFYKAPSPTLKAPSFAIAVQKVQTDLNNKDYYVTIKLTNLKSEEQLFDSGEMELVDTATGISYFSIAKDNASVTIPAHMNTVILKRSLPAGAATTGMIWFKTQIGEANAAKLLLKYGGSSVELIED